MVRRGPWKLNYYHGFPSQLFNLEEDPREMADRMGDPSCKVVVNELTAAVLRDWDPDIVAAEMARRRADAPILSGWARNTTPADQCRWDLRPEMSYLDPEQMS